MASRFTSIHHGDFTILQAPLLRINSVTDHIHIGFQLPRTQTMALLVKEVKVGSSLWIKQKQNQQLFQWQQGLARFQSVQIILMD